jgi:serpin B
MDMRLLDGAVHTVEPARFQSANAVWVARHRTLKPTYLDAVSRLLPAEVHSIDFATDPTRAQQMINGWVSEHTRGKIPQIMQGGAITERTRAALVNAVHFVGKWSDPFEHALTAPKPFRTAQGATVQAQTMVGSTCSAVFEGDYQAAFANYDGTSLAFVMVVPKRWGTFRWDAAAFRRIWAALATSRRTDLELPRFSLRSRKELPDVLNAIDVDLNDPQLFEGMLTSGEALSIDLAIHEAFIQVDETATEAAAATAITAVPISASEPVPVFRVNRPFYFALVERRTGLIVMMGQVTDPTNTGG